MTDAKSTTSEPPSDQDVWAAIVAFQKILEVMPNDRATLEGLAHAFEQIGDLTQARDYLLRLGEVLVAEGDYDAARQLLDRLEAHSRDDERVATLIARIRGLPGGEESDHPLGEPAGVSLSAPEAPPALTDTLTPAPNLAEEMSCAWNLLQAGQITEEQYATVIQDLTELSASKTQITVSVLHVLESRGFKRLDKVIEYLQETCGTPFVSLTSFEIPPEAAQRLPVSFMIARGAVVFGFVGDQPLVAVLNPFSQKLREEILQRCRATRAHFFLTLPSEFDAVLTRLQETRAGSA